MARVALGGWIAARMRMRPWGLAMIHAALGNTQEAHDHYDRAAAVIDRFAPRGVGWNYKQDLAAAALGIQR